MLRYDAGKPPASVPGDLAIYLAGRSDPILIRVSDQLDFRHEEDRAVERAIRAAVVDGAMEGRYAGVVWSVL